MIDPVTFWGADSTQISASDQQMLVNFFNQQLNSQLGQKFQIVNQPDPGVMKLDVALIDAEAATPGMRSISMIVVPQAQMLSNLKYLATGFQWEWGDAENAINKWSEMLVTRLSDWTSGAKVPD
jgi:hypothetical protein